MPRSANPALSDPLPRTLHTLTHTVQRRLFCFIIVSAKTTGLACLLPRPRSRTPRLVKICQTLFSGISCDAFAESYRRCAVRRRVQLISSRRCCLLIAHSFSVSLPVLLFHHSPIIFTLLLFLSDKFTVVYCFTTSFQFIIIFLPFTITKKTTVALVNINFFNFETQSAFTLFKCFQLTINRLKPNELSRLSSALDN